ncbi:MAG TPA: DUF6029 family protein [bacterium]|nr:DUF6029 family protein [bacterium]
MRLFWLILFFSVFAVGQETAAVVPEEKSDEPLLADEDILLPDEEPVATPVPAPTQTAPAAVQVDKKAVPGEEARPPLRFTGYSSSRSNVRIGFKREDTSTPEDLADLSNETLLEGHYDAYTLGVRKNLVLFFGRNYDFKVDNFAYRYSAEAFNHGWQYYLERIYLKGDWDVVDVTIGDFYESMNRGLLFSMLDDPAGEDNAIRGLSTVVKAGDFHAKAFGGKANPYLRDTVVLERMGEADDILWGTEAGYKFLQSFDIGVEYGGGFHNDYTVDRANWDDPDSLRKYESKYYHVVGAYLDMFRLIPQVNAYIGATLVPAGVDRLTREMVWGDDKKRADLTLANALYFSVLNWYDISKSRLTLTVEGKRYDHYWLNYREMEHPDFKRRYFRPPALLWENLPLLNEYNTMALRTRAQFADNDLTGLTAAVEFIGGLADKYDTDWNWNADLAPKENYWFVAGSLDRRIGPATLLAKAGFLKVNGASYSDYNSETLYTQLLAGLGKAGFSGKLNLEVYYRDLVLQGVDEERDAVEQKHVLDLSWKNTIFLSYLGSYYFNRSMRNDNGYYPGGSVGYGYRDLRVSLFGGTMRGGLTCIGGICRKLPPFTGVKLELDVKL